MLISIVILYLLGLVMLALSLMARQSLRGRKGNDASKGDRCLYSLSGSTLPWAMLLPLIVLGMELGFAFTIPMQNWSQTIERYNEAGPPAFLFQFPIMVVGITIVYFAIDYFSNPRGRYDIVTAIGNQWFWALLVLYVIVAVTGVLTGLLV